MIDGLHLSAYPGHQGHRAINKAAERSVNAPPPLAEVGVKLVLQHGGLQLSQPTPPDQRPAAARNTPPGLPPAAPAGLEECGAGLPAVEGGGGGPGAVVLGGPQGDLGEHVLHGRGAGHQEDQDCQEAHGLVSVRGATEGSGKAPGTECDGGGRRGPVHPGAQPAGGSCHPAVGGQAGEQEAGGGGNTHCNLSAVCWGLQSAETGHRKKVSVNSGCRIGGQGCQAARPGLPTGWAGHTHWCHGLSSVGLVWILDRQPSVSLFSQIYPFATPS